MSTVFLPEFDAVLEEREPEVIVDETDFAFTVELHVPGAELHQFAIYVLDHTLAVTCGEAGWRHEFDVAADADPKHLTVNLDEGWLEIRVPKLSRHDTAGHMRGFHPDAAPS